MDNNTTNKTQRVRGSARIQPDGTFDFKPDGQGVKKIEEVRQARKSRCYRTAGEKQQTLVAHLTVDANAKDPAYEMYKDFREVVKTLPGFEKLPTPQGRVLEKNDDFRLTVNQAQGRIEASFQIDLRQHADFMKQFYELLNQMSKCLYYNEDFLKKQCRALASSSTK